MSPNHPSASRRHLLATIGALGSGAYAGCLFLDENDDNGEDNENGENDDNEEDEDNGETATPVETPPEETVEFEVETIAEGFDEPWGLVMLPDQDELLVTELSGSLSLVDRDTGSVTAIEGVPSVHASGQGGLLDVELHPDFPEEPWVYVTYAATDEDGRSATHLARGQLHREDASLDDVEVLYTVEPFREGSQHFGSRVTFGSDGLVYLTSGDRGDKTFSEEHPSQDRTNAIGATIRLTPDGDIPPDNPFVDDADALDELYSYGHRNAQGMTVHPETGELWQSEHGERDGDALHVIEAGGNYGWPIAHTGCEYASDDPVGDDPHDRDDVVNPVYYWPCESGGFPPAGMTFYDGDAFPAWEGDLFVGNLAGEYLGRFTVDGHDVEEVDPLLDDRGWRIRDVAVAPDTGHVYVAIDAMDTPLVRLVPR